MHSPRTLESGFVFLPTKWTAVFCHSWPVVMVVAEVHGQQWREPAVTGAQEGAWLVCEAGVPGLCVGAWLSRGHAVH